MRIPLSALRAVAIAVPLLATGVAAGMLLDDAATGKRATATGVTRVVTATRVEPVRSPAPHADGERVPVATWPDAAAIARARGWLKGRAGRTAFAVVDDRGLLHGTRMHEQFESASLIKAMLLVACLRELDARGAVLDAGTRALLDPMIRSSDNDAASAIFARVGEAGLRELAADAGMTDFASLPAWGSSAVSAADQARFFALLDRLLPRRSARYARGLLAGVVPDQSWGIPAVARPAGWTVLFKGGWRERIVNQAARLERRGRTIAIAVLSDDNPSMGYGIATAEGVTRALLER